jgi:hypothetical protein
MDIGSSPAPNEKALQATLDRETDPKAKTACWRILSMPVVSNRLKRAA